ncbi:MAG: four helix bundle protein [Bdellovibrionales bacterium]|nr:four helix bundle protein [Bdellovibrionales bacterium]
MKTFRTLELAIEFYELSEQLELVGNLKDQLTRAASSIALNLSEGNAKRTVPEKKRYYHTAYASCQECKTILRLAKIAESEINQVVDRLGASLYKLLQSEIKSIQNSVYG